MTPVTGAPTRRIAVLDDDTGFLQVLGNRLESAGWEHQVLAPRTRVEDLTILRLHALMVDPAAVDPDGWAFLDSLFTRLSGLGVIVCTGQSRLADRVRGLRLGADDWLTKPCHPEELIARVEAVLRRRDRGLSSRELGASRTGELEIRPDQVQVFVADGNLGLTRREFELIAVLVKAQGQVIERDEIYQRVWGYSMARGDRSVDVFVRKLRAKLARASPGWN